MPWCTILAGKPGDRDVCSFATHYAVKEFDAAFAGKYREHMFRYADLVPTALRLDWRGEERSVQGNGGGQHVPVLALRKSDMAAPAGSSAVDATGCLLQPGSSVDLPCATSAAASFAGAAVLRIASLYDIHVVLPGDQDNAFEAKWRLAIKKSSVRQY